MINDCNLIANKDNSEFIWNSKFPLNSLYILRGYIFVNDEIKDLYLNTMFNAYWKYNLDISNKEIFKKLLDKCHINSNIFYEGINDSEIKDNLKILTQTAHKKGVFGTPTFVINNKIFWGQDRLEFALDEYNK